MRLLPWIAAIAVSATSATVASAQQDAAWNEAATRHDIRAVIKAEEAYAALNCGYFDRLDCLAAPETCIPYHKGPPLLSEALAELANRHGYRRSFHMAPSPSKIRIKCSPTSVKAWAYVAVPVAPGFTGRQSFCADRSGRICQFKDGSEPKVVNGMCPQDCR
jgi:hypothetical protein